MKSEIIQVGQIGIHFLLESADTNGAVAMFEFTVPVGAKMPLPHSHKHYDETIYGVEGVLTFTVEGKPVDIGPGESCFVPAAAAWPTNPKTDWSFTGSLTILGRDVQTSSKWARFTNRIAEPDSAANGSRPIRAETNSTSSAAGSRR